MPNGYVQRTFEDETGQLDFRLEYALEKFSTEKGRLATLGIGPRSSARGFGLNAVRSASIGQGVLDHLLSEQMVATAAGNLWPLLLKTGTVGIAGWTSKLGDRTYGHIEVIHPRELIPIPARIESGGDLIGIIRRRMVPFEWAMKQPLWAPVLKKMKEGKKVTGLGGSYHSWGYVPDATLYDTRHEEAFIDLNDEQNAWSVDEASVSSDKTGRSKGSFYIRLNEVYLLGPDRTVARYIAHAGHTVIVDIDYAERDERVPMPIGIARYNDIGEFYGRSFLYPLITLNRELEETYKIFMDQLQDQDWLGMTLIPANIGLSHRDFKQTTKPRLVFYENTWDMGTGHQEITHIKPTNLGMFPINIANVLTEMLNLQSGQSAIYQGAAPGRVDSAASIQALTEAGNTGLKGPIDSIAAGFSQAYASVLYQAKVMMAEGEAIHMRSLDPKILGVVLDPETGTMDLRKNPIPEWDEVNIGIESIAPKSRGQRMQELAEGLQSEIITPVDYRIIARRENLELPLAADGEWETYRMTMLNIRYLFGDGKTAGKALIRPEIDNIPVAIEYISAFMRSPEFSLSSVAVRDAFKAALDKYRQAQGAFPENLQDPEVLAELAQAQGQGQGQGQGLEQLPDELAGVVS